MKVRPLAPPDYPLWVKMRQGLLPDPGRDDLAELEKLHAPWIVLVAEDNDGMLVGYAHAAIRSVVEGVWFESSAYLEEIWVEPGARRRGVATSLLQGVTEWAGQQGVHHIGSDTELSNEISQAWHLAAGFEELERAVIFGKPLTV